MSDWKIILPEATQNLTLNPSGEIVGNFAAVGGGTMTRVTTSSKYGLYSYRIQTAANDEGGSLTLQALANAIHYVTLFVRGTIPTWDWSLDNANYTAPALLLDIDTEWSLYGLQFPAAQANASTTLYVRQNGAGAGDFSVDGAQVEAKEYWTTYTDGAQAGCEWLGVPNASISQRSAQSRAGGRARDLTDYFYWNISTLVGTGASPIDISSDAFALLPGAAQNNIKVDARTFSILGPIKPPTGVTLHNARKALLDALNHLSYPKSDGEWQPVRFWYTGNDVVKEIKAHYVSGLGANWPAEFIPCWDKIGVRFEALDPIWREIGDSAAVLDTEDAAATLRYIAGRLRATGQWDDLGRAVNPAAGGTVFAIKYNPHDGLVYIGGNFTDFFNDASGADYAVVYNPQTDTWARMGAANAVSATVETIKIAPNGDVYFGGWFQNLGGVAGDNVAYWDIDAGPAAWVPVAAGGAPGFIVYDIEFGLDGTLYVGGNFANWNGIGANHCVKLPVGGAWTVMDAGNELNNPCYAIRVHPSGNLYIGGVFTQFGANVCNRWCLYDLTDYQIIDTSFDAPVYTFDIDPAGNVYCGGTFTTPDSYITRWDGQQFISLETGTNALVQFIHIAPDGMVYVGGNFTIAGSITVADRGAKWNGSAWAHLDVDLFGAPTVYAIETCRQAPTINSNYDVYLGFTTTGAAEFAGLVTVNNPGSTDAYPLIIFQRDGGTEAIIQSIRNEDIGQEILFDYPLLDGERLTIDLNPQGRSIMSSFFGSRFDAALKGSDLGVWHLQQGDNDISAFVSVAGAPTITAYLQWRDPYDSFD